MAPDPIATERSGKATIPAPKALKLPRALATVERWAKLAGKEVSRAQGTPESGPPFPFLHIKHGDNPVLARMEGDTVVVSAFANLEAPFRAALGKLAQDDLERVDLRLREQLLSDPRVGYGMVPPSAKSLVEVERIIVECQVVIEEGDPSTRQALLDSIQEVVVVMQRTLLGIRLLDPALAVAPATGSGKSPPESMYG